MLAVAFATLGAVQYAITGWVVDLLLSKNKRQFFPTKRYVIPLLVLIFFPPYGAKYLIHPTTGF